MYTNNTSLLPAQYLSDKGIEYRARGTEATCKCPFTEHQNDHKSPAFNVNLETGLWKCHKCDTSGNMVTLAKHFDDDIRPWIKFHGGEEYDLEAKNEAHATQKEVENLMTNRSDAVQLIKIKPLCTDWREHLLLRGITEEVIDSAELACSDTDPAWLVIPIKNQDGLIATQKQRRPFSLSDDGPKYKNTRGASVRLYQPKALDDEVTELYITEGELDTLVLLSHGLTAVSSTGGAAKFEVAWLDQVDKTATINLCFDNDKAGKKAARKVTNDLITAGFTTIKQLTFPTDAPEAYDISDIQRAGESVSEYLKQHLVVVDVTKYSTYQERLWSQPRSFGELKQIDFPPRDWLINSILPEGGIVTLAAYAGVGKSFLALHLINCLMSKQSFMGLYPVTNKSIRALVIDGEQNTSQLMNRASCLLSEEMVKDNVFFLNTSSLNFTQETVLRWLTDHIESFDINLVIVDTFRAFSGGIDDSDANAVSEFYKYFQMLKEIGVTIIMIDHTRKKKEGQSATPSLEHLYGSQDKAARVDGVIMLTKGDECLEFHQVKNRDQAEIPAFKYRMNLNPMTNFFDFTYLGEITEADRDSRVKKRSNCGWEIHELLEEGAKSNISYSYEEMSKELPEYSKRMIVDAVKELVTNDLAKLDNDARKQSGASNKHYYTVKHANDVEQIPMSVTDGLTAATV